MYQISNFHEYGPGRVPLIGTQARDILDCILTSRILLSGVDPDIGKPHTQVGVSACISGWLGPCLDSFPVTITGKNGLYDTIVQHLLFHRINADIYRLISLFILKFENAGKAGKINVIFWSEPVINLYDIKSPAFITAKSCFFITHEPVLYW